MYDFLDKLEYYTIFLFFLFTSDEQPVQRVVQGL